MHGYLKMFVKIIKCEMQLDDADCDEIDKHQPTSDDYKVHEFSKYHVAHYGHVLRKFLVGEETDQEESLYQMILPSLVRKRATEFATTKASAEEMSQEDYFDGAEMNKRNKCIVEVLKLVREKNLSNIIFSHLSPLLSHLESEGGIMANMFRKQRCLQSNPG